MSMKLNLAEHLLSLGQHYLRLGRDRDAQQSFQRLIQFPDLKSAIIEEAQAGLADVHLRRNDPVQARRHLHVALARQPDCAYYHHQLALTLEEEDAERAIEHYARALQLDPDNAQLHADMGMFLLAIAEQELGLTHLRRAVELAPDEPVYLRQLMKSLVEADRAMEARGIVQLALFAHPREHRFREIWSELQFRVAQQEQHRAILARWAGHDRPVLLPFKPRRTQVLRSESTDDGSTVRVDRPQPIRRPHLRKPAKRRPRA
jgi:tetratricopeptide (TPR) repeat protein